MRTFIAIIIDQLRWEDRTELPALEEFLGSPTCMNIPYLPTVTETAHATVGTGGSPSSHGVIGSETIQGNTAYTYCQVTDQTYSLNGYRIENLPLQRICDAEIQCFIIAGKKKVAQLIDPRPGASMSRLDATRITYRQTGGSLVLEPLDKRGKSDSLLALFKEELPEAMVLDDKAGIDGTLLDIADLALSHLRDHNRRAFMFVGLPNLDKVGHRAWRGSDFSQATKLLNELLSEFLRFVNKQISGNELRVVVTSDHGCRSVDHWVFPSWTNDRLVSRDEEIGSWRVEAWNVNGLENKLELPAEVVTYCHENAGLETPAIFFDGGTARLWVRKNSEEKVADVIRQRWHPYISMAFPVAWISEQLGATGAFSYHPNWGDVVMFASPSTALCKREWIVSRGANIIFPLGEHGTHFDEDRKVPFWGTFSEHHDLFRDAQNFLTQR